MVPWLFIRGDEVVEKDPDQSTITDRYTDEALKFIRAHHEKPFFLYLAHNFPHTPLHVPERLKGKSERGLYGDVIMGLDESTGKILDALKELNIDEQTLVIYTSDNGPWHIRGEAGGNATPLRAGKGTTYEGGMRVPCVMCWPGTIPAGSMCAELTTAMDFMPTIAKFADAKAPADRIIDGKDISELMLGKQDAKSPYEVFYYYSGNRLNAVRSGKWKLKLKTSLQEETEYGKYENPQAAIPPALYNLDVDIGEQKNVLQDHPDIVEKLQALAERSRADLGDLRTGMTGKKMRPIGKIAD